MFDRLKQSLKDHTSDIAILFKRHNLLKDALNEHIADHNKYGEGLLLLEKKQKQLADCLQLEYKGGIYIKNRKV